MKNQHLMPVTCLDFEGVLIPEIWIGLSEKTGISDLRLTTRDISDYDQLMKMRLSILEKNHLTLNDLHDVVNTMEPLDGAKDFLTWLRQRSEVILLSDTFREFVAPIMPKLGFPTLFCHSLIIDEKKHIINYNLRQKDQKRKAIEALKKLNFRTIAAGDSYNDLSMLLEADLGILFRPPENLPAEYPQFPVTHTYENFKEHLCQQAGLPELF